MWLGMTNRHSGCPHEREKRRSATVPEDKTERWLAETSLLRKTLLECGVREEIKWNKSCFTYQGKNICIIQNMKGFLALLFFNGVLLDDPEGLLEIQGPNSRSDCRMRFTNSQGITQQTHWIKAFVMQSIEHEKANRMVVLAPELEYPGELITKLASDHALKEAFIGLTPGRQRGYVLYFSGAKQSATRIKRIDKYRLKILQGKGMLER